MGVKDEIASVTERIIARSRPTRSAYLDLIARERAAGVNRVRLSCGNLAHGFAAAEGDQAAIRSGSGLNIGIVTAYNDMLSAHQPYGRYPGQIKIFAREVGATAQVAGGVPAMCDGVTQGQPGMELSLLSRDTIALSTAVALSHGMFEAAALLGTCDKIVPGLLIGALRLGHLPAMFIPAGPMPSGLPNGEKQRIRQLFAEGRAARAALLEAEAASYHAPGVCTFYGTANSNQVMLEAMGLQMPGSAFVPPASTLRTALTRASVHRLAEIGWNGNDYRPLGACIDERAIVNAAVALLATGGSTNHSIHLPAIARAAGILIDWEDLDRLSRAVPLIARIYPNGTADVNGFHAAGGTAFTIATLLDANLLHADVLTTAGSSLHDHARIPRVEGSALLWDLPPPESGDTTVLRPAGRPFRPEGGLRLVQGRLGRGIFKTSAVDEDRWIIEAPSQVFDRQDEVLAAFADGALDRDVVVVVRFQGPRANGMPELHRLTPLLGVLQDRGFRVALVTDGRMSGASGKVPAAIHVTPEAAGGGPLARMRDGDIVRLDAANGELTVLIDQAEWDARSPALPPRPTQGTGRELFRLMRASAPGAEQGASSILADLDELAI